MATTDRPRCLACGKKLRPYKYRIGGPRPIEGENSAKQWGDYGDNHFCGLNCGYVWSVTYLRNRPDYAANVHANMNEIMERREAQEGKA